MCGLFYTILFGVHGVMWEVLGLIISWYFFGKILLSNSARAKINSAELFERGTEVDQVYFNPGYSHSYSIDAKEHRQRKNTKGPPLCFVRTYLYLCLNAEQLNKVNV